MNYYEIIITFFNTLNTELLHETISYVSPKHLKMRIQIHILFTRVKGRNSPSCPSADE